MASQAVLAILVVFAAAVHANIVPPKACIPSICAALPDIYPPTSANYSSIAAWNTTLMRNVAFYRGVYNKIAEANNVRKPVGNLTFAQWKATRNFNTGGARPAPLFLNLEKHPIERSFILKSERVGLKTCCNTCRELSGCVLYLYVPDSPTSNARLNAVPALGTCYYLTGGTEKKDGPYSWKTGINYGTPASGDRAWQADSKNTAPMGFLGGFCNPGNSTTNVTDDPHFTGAHGTHFEFNGQLDKTYCLVTDKSFHINAVLKGYKTENTFHATVGSDGKAIRSWIRELGMVWRASNGESHSLRLVARASKSQERGVSFLSAAEYDGVAFQFPTQPGQSFSAGEMTLTLTGVGRKGWYDVEHYSLTVGSQVDMNFDMRVAHPKLQSPDDAEAHFNLMFNDIAVTPSVHGVLGQTYRSTTDQAIKAIKYSELGRILGSPIQADGETGKGFLDGSVSDYVSSSVTSADCKVSAFSASA